MASHLDGMITNLTQKMSALIHEEMKRYINSRDMHKVVKGSTRSDSRSTDSPETGIGESTINILATKIKDERQPDVSDNIIDIG